MKVSMLRTACALLAVMTAMPLLSQVEYSEGIIYTLPEQETRMITPPAVSGVNLQLMNEASERANYLSGGVTLNTAYVSNVQPGETTSPVNDESYSIWPILTLDQRSPRMTRMLAYSSGFTFYQKTSALDSINQSMDASVDYGLSPRLTLSLRDSFRQNSNVFNQPLDATTGTASPPTGGQAPGVILPFEEELKNDVSGIFSYQYAQFSMVGGKVGYASLDFPNSTKGSGLYNSSSESALGFYSWRATLSQYFGAMYQGAKVVTSQLNSTTQIQTLSFFYTFYTGRDITLSLTAGPQYMSFTEPGSSSYQKWTPSLKASVGWETSHIRLTSDYARNITAGQGIPGAYTSNSADASLRYQLASNWVVNSLVVYENDKNSLPSSLQNYPGGNTLSATASAEYNMNTYLVMGLGYTHLHQNYSGITEIAHAPDSDRVFFSLSYYFRRPMGR